MARLFPRVDYQVVAFSRRGEDRSLFSPKGYRNVRRLMKVLEVEK